MKDIVFSCYRYEYTGKNVKHLHCQPNKVITLFCFYQKGIWDENKMTLAEALNKYPPGKYNWLVSDN